MIPVKEFSSAAEMRAHYARIRKRTYNVHTKPKPKEEPKVIHIQVTKPHVRDWMILNYANNLDPVAYLKSRCSELGVSYETIISLAKTTVISYQRQLIMFEMREKFGLSYKKIGDIFGNRDHTSVIYNIEKVKQYGYDMYFAQYELAKQGNDVGLAKLKKVKLSHTCKLTENEVREIRKAVYDGARPKQVSWKYGVSVGTVCDIARRDTWRHVE